MIYDDLKISFWWSRGGLPNDGNQWLIYITSMRVVRNIFHVISIPKTSIFQCYNVEMGIVLGGDVLVGSTPLASEKREYSNVIMWKWAYFFGGWGECIGGMIQKHVVRRPHGRFFSVVRYTIVLCVEYIIRQWCHVCERLKRRKWVRCSMG